MAETSSVYCDDYPFSTYEQFVAEAIHQVGLMKDYYDKIIIGIVPEIFDLISALQKDMNELQYNMGVLQLDFDSKADLDVDGYIKLEQIPKLELDEEYIKFIDTKFNNFETNIEVQNEDINDISNVVDDIINVYLPKKADLGSDGKVLSNQLP